MKLIRNTGNDRVIDELRHALVAEWSLDLASPTFSLFAFAELRDALEKLKSCRMLLPLTSDGEAGLVGAEADRSFRNRLQTRWLARECAAWAKAVEMRSTPTSLPQSILIAGNAGSGCHRVITGSCAFTTEGLGITPDTRSASSSARRSRRNRRSWDRGSPASGTRCRAPAILLTALSQA